MTRRLAMFPLSTVLFPGARLPLQVFEARYRALLADCLRGDGELGIVLIARGSEVGGGDERMAVGTAARLGPVSELDDGRLLVVVTGLGRVRVVEWLPERPYPCAQVEDLADEGGSDEGGSDEVGSDEGGSEEEAAVGAASAALRRLRALLSELGAVLPPASGTEGVGTPTDGSEGAVTPTNGPEGAVRAPDRAWQLCDLAPLDALDRQHLLEAGGVGPRMELLVELCSAKSEDVIALLAGGLGGGIGG